MKKIKLHGILLSFFLALFSSAGLAADNDTAGYTDAGISQAVSAKIAADQTVSSLHITVKSNGGNVSLIGKTHTDKEAGVLVEIAESTPGVRDVDTGRLRVEKSAHPLDDTYITAKVKGTFAKNKLFGDTDVPVTSISVETKNGVVYLTGTADSKEQAENAVTLAKAVRGVKSVESKVVVR